MNLWDTVGAELRPSFAGPLIKHLGHKSEDIRSAAAKALAAGLQARVPAICRS